MKIYKITFENMSTKIPIDIVYYKTLESAKAAVETFLGKSLEWKSNLWDYAIVQGFVVSIRAYDVSE